MIGNDRSNHPECGCFSNCYPIREFHMNNEQYLGWFLHKTPKWLPPFVGRRHKHTGNRYIPKDQPNVFVASLAVLMPSKPNPPWCFQAKKRGKRGSHWIVEKVITVYGWISHCWEDPFFPIVCVNPIPPVSMFCRVGLSYSLGKISPQRPDKTRKFHKRGYHLHLENKICQQNAHPLGDLVFFQYIPMFPVRSRIWLFSH